MGYSYLAGQYCIMQDAAMDKTIYVFAPQSVCIVLYSTVKASKHKRNFPINNLFPSITILCLDLELSVSNILSSLLSFAVYYPISLDVTQWPMDPLLVTIQTNKHD